MTARSFAWRSSASYWIEVTYRVGLAEGGVIVDHVCEYTYRFVQSDAPVSDEIRKQSWETGVPV